MVRLSLARALVGALALLLQACAYVEVKRPLDTDVETTYLGTKVGRASNQAIMWLFAWGDAGTHAAAKEGGITTIRHLDAEYYVILFGLYARYTTIAYGD